MTTKKTVERWKPEEGEFYFCVNINTSWYDKIQPAFVNTSIWRKKFSDPNNCFRTKREATAVCKELNRAIKQILKSK
jgi:hypothetical protein